jgi:hypothetical protein
MRELAHRPLREPAWLIVNAGAIEMLFGNKAQRPTIATDEITIVELALV